MESIVDKQCMGPALKNPELNGKNKLKMRWYCINKGVVDIVLIWAVEQMSITSELSIPWDDGVPPNQLRHFKQVTLSLWTSVSSPVKYLLFKFKII